LTDHTGPRAIEIGLGGRAEGRGSGLKILVRDAEKILKDLRIGKDWWTLIIGKERGKKIAIAREILVQFPV
jgi:hypothetical protein